VLACNTASAKALRTIQQHDLPEIDPQKRVLGVIRPTTEVIGNYSDSKQVGILATAGTVSSSSYVIEIEKFFPEVKVFQQACPMWVPLVENEEYDSHGADYFVKKCIEKLLDQSPAIDTILLACTHYPLLHDKIREYTPADIKILSQGEIVANSFSDYLLRHPEIEKSISRAGERHFYTTDSTTDFDRHAASFYGAEIKSLHIDLEAQKL
jgi:glutamate racemase